MNNQQISIDSNIIGEETILPTSNDQLQDNSILPDRFNSTSEAEKFTVSSKNKEPEEDQDNKED